MFRLLAGLFGLLLFRVLLPVAGLVAVLWATLPPRTAEAPLSGLSAPVRIAFDPDGVPLHPCREPARRGRRCSAICTRAQRMFQMDMMRRTGSGRVSEIAGPGALPPERDDARARPAPPCRGGAAGGQAALRWALLDAYARGVNAWIAQRGRFAAPEFVPFGTPAPWTPVDSLLWGKSDGASRSPATGAPSWRGSRSRGTSIRRGSTSCGLPEPRAGRPDAVRAARRPAAHAEPPRAVLAAIPPSSLRR